MWNVIYSELSAHHSRREWHGEIDDMQLEQELLRLQKLSLVEMQVEYQKVTGETPARLEDYRT